MTLREAGTPRGPANPLLVAVTSLLGLSAVALGAFGAHGLKDHLSPAALEIYRTGALYHLVHAVAALAVALAADRLRRATLTVALFAVGIFVFAGSLYALAITGVRALGAVTPLGGLALMAAWAMLAAELFPSRRR